MAAKEADAPMCRYCFSSDAEDGELISPCACKGSQEFVHLACLRRWQRMVLVSQPTHPQFYRDDIRHHECNVCKAPFTCPPPTRHELMESFTGAEIAALIKEGCVIGAHKVFSAELESQLETLPPFARVGCGYVHWIGGCYLITGVTEDDGQVQIPVDSQEELETVRARLGPELAITLRGQRLVLVAAGSLEGVEPEALGEALGRLSTPCTIVLGDNVPKTCGDDNVAAINLTRPIEPPDRAALEANLERVREGQLGAAADAVSLEHYDGGPVEAGEIVTCIVVGGSARGWSVHQSLVNAMEKAYGRAATRRVDGQGGPWLGAGQSVVLHGLQARPDLNGEVGIAVKYNQEKGRWLVTLRNGEGVRVKVANLQPQPGVDAEQEWGGRVLVAWGDARWSRTQLLGEIARGHWGLGKASVCELTAGPPERWAGLDGRLCFSPTTEMTEDFMRDAERQMQAAHQEAERQGLGADDSDAVEDDAVSVSGGSPSPRPSESR